MLLAATASTTLNVTGLFLLLVGALVATWALYVTGRQFEKDLVAHPDAVIRAVLRSRVAVRRWIGRFVALCVNLQ